MLEALDAEALIDRKEIANAGCMFLTFAQEREVAEVSKRPQGS